MHAHWSDRFQGKLETGSCLPSPTPLVPPVCMVPSSIPAPILCTGAGLQGCKVQILAAGINMHYCMRTATSSAPDPWCSTEDTCPLLLASEPLVEALLYIVSRAALLTRNEQRGDSERQVHQHTFNQAMAMAQALSGDGRSDLPCAGYGHNWPGTRQSARCQLP